MKMEPLLALQYNQELLQNILELMTYREIVELCNTHPQFKALCDDPGSIVGQTLRSKEVIATVKMLSFHEDLLDFEVEITGGDVVAGDFKVRLGADHIPELMGEGPVFVVLGEDDFVISTTTENMVRIHSASEDVGLTMYHDTLRTIIRVAEDMNREQLEGITEIHRDRKTEYIA